MCVCVLFIPTGEYHLSNLLLPVIRDVSPYSENIKPPFEVDQPSQAFLIDNDDENVSNISTYLCSNLLDIIECNLF